MNHKNGASTLPGGPFERLKYFVWFQFQSFSKLSSGLYPQKSIPLLLSPQECSLDIEGFNIIPSLGGCKLQD